MTFHDWLQFALRVAFNGLGWAGGAFIAYGVIAQFTVPWEPLERIATWLSSFLTVLGTVLTTASIYSSWASHPHEPDALSQLVTAPVVLFAGGCALGILLWKRTLPFVVVNGFALLGLAGGLLRLQPRPPGW